MRYWLFIAALLLPWSAVRSDEPVNLRWSWAVGDEFDVSIKEQASTVSVYYPLSSRQESEVILDLHWRVVDTDGDVARLEQTVKRIRLDLVTPTDDGSGRITLDTARDESLRGTAGALYGQLSSLVDLIVVVRLKSDGSIVGVELPEASIERLRRAPSATVLREMFSPEGMERMFSQSNIVLPASPVNVDDEWQAALESEAWAGKQLAKVYRLRGSERVGGRSLARLEFEYLLRNAPAATADAAESVAQPKIVDFSGTGFARFDVSLGNFSETESTLELTTHAPLRDAHIETKVNKKSRMEIVRRVR